LRSASRPAPASVTHIVAETLPVDSGRMRRGEERDGTEAPPVARAAEDGERCAGGKVARPAREGGGGMQAGLSSRAGRSEADGE
jgi:hypothetical protein